MAVTLGLVANVYQEANALPGWIETHIPFFDNVRVTHAGPQGTYSNDGTIEILQKWNIPIDYDSIDDGFGAVRTRAIRRSPCDYVMILDADERFFQINRIMRCGGISTPHNEVDAILQTYDFHDLNTMIPNWENVARLGAQLTVEMGSAFNYGHHLRHILNEEKPHAVVSSRRHWHDFSFKRPTQNWETDPDWQMRIVKNDKSIYFDPTTRMHERLTGTNKVVRILNSSAICIYFDHFHFTFKRMEQAQRSHDIAIYDSIHAGKTPPNLEEFNKKRNKVNIPTQDNPTYIQ